MKSVDWSSIYAPRLEWMTTSVIREILKVAQSDDVISLAGGWPEAGLFPIEQLIEISQYVLDEMPRESLQYQTTDGFTPLRELLAEQMTSRGMPCKVENIAITSGSMQGLDLAGRIFLTEGDTMLVEEPTFLGALQTFKSFGVNFATVPVDDQGARVDLLPEIIERTAPKMMYLLPTFQNPAGATMTLERRKRAVEIAAEMGVPIIEDDPYGQLRFSGEPLPTLLELDMARYEENSATQSYARGDVIYLSTFSKTMAPGLRLAWAVCPPEIRQNFVMAKQGTDLHTNAMAQTMAYEFLRRGCLPDQVERIRETYRGRCEAMIEAIAEFFPPDVHYIRPEGGLFLWVTLPSQCDTVALLQEAAEQKVAFVPGGPFFANGGGQNTLRMSYASVPPETIREGIRRLGEVIKAQLAACSEG
jgi:2-aminoadipate transaminase